MDYEKLIQNLIEKGWGTQEHFLSNHQCLELINEANQFNLKPAQIGKGTRQIRSSEIRNDSIYWLEDQAESEWQKDYLLKIDELKNRLNQELYLGLKQFEGHFALYEPQGFYKKHLDQFAGNNERLISIITYLNSQESGGELRLYKREAPDEVDCDLRPEAGLMVCFLSNQIYHEVLPTMNHRYAITGWLRTTIK